MPEVWHFKKPFEAEALYQKHFSVYLHGFIDSDFMRIFILLKK